MSCNAPIEPLHERIDTWVRDLNPRNRVEMDLAEHAARLSHEVEELKRIQGARDAHHRRTAHRIAATKAEAEVITLGRELIDAAGDEWGRRNLQWEGQTKPTPDPIPRSPDLVVHLLKATALGCRWMAEQWDELISILDDGLDWGNADERRALRLLGKIPDVDDNREVRELRLAHCVMTRQVPPHLGALTEEKLGRPVPSKDEGRATLRGICDRVADRLRNLATERDAEAGSIDEREEILRHSFDASKEAKELRRQQSTAHRELLRTLEILSKMKKQPVQEEEPSSGFATFSHEYAGEGRIQRPSPGNPGEGARRAGEGPQFQFNQPSSGFATFSHEYAGEGRVQRPSPGTPGEGARRAGEGPQFQSSHPTPTPSPKGKRKKVRGRDEANSKRSASLGGRGLTFPAPPINPPARLNPARPPMSGSVKSCKIVPKRRREEKDSRPPPPKG